MDAWLHWLLSEIQELQHTAERIEATPESA